MWIKQVEFLDLVRQNSLLQASLQSEKAHSARLEREIDYWREKFEQAQNRADRITDSMSKVSGLGPVSDLGLKEFAEQEKKYKQMMEDAQKQATEMFADEIPGESESGELEVAPDLAEMLVKSMKSE